VGEILQERTGLTGYADAGLFRRRRIAFEALIAVATFARNMPTTRTNTSPVFIEAADRIIQFMVVAGLPEG
jgi:hypothetical protein